MFSVFAVEFCVCTNTKEAAHSNECNVCNFFIYYNCILLCFVVGGIGVGTAPLCTPNSVFGNFHQDSVDPIFPSLDSGKLAHYDRCFLALPGHVLCIRCCVCSNGVTIQPCAYTCASYVVLQYLCSLKWALDLIMITEFSKAACVPPAEFLKAPWTNVTRETWAYACDEFLDRQDVSRDDWPLYVGKMLLRLPCIMSLLKIELSFVFR